MQAYRDVLNRAQQVGNLPYVPYTGELVAPLNAQQLAGISQINQYAQSAQPTMAQAIAYAQQAGQPVSQSLINQFVNPWTQQVVGATQAQFANQNIQQAQALRGNAVSQGAMGGSREMIAQAELANQQAMGQAPVIAGLESQGYLTGLNTALTEQQALQNAAYGMGNLAMGAQNAALTGANAVVGAGTLQQQTQQAQDVAKYQQFLNQQAFPYQQVGWLAGIDTGVGSNMGGTSTSNFSMQGPSPSAKGQIGGAAMSGLGMLGKGMGMADGGRVTGMYRGGGVTGDSRQHLQGGGVAGAIGGWPYATASGYVPNVPLTHGPGPPQAHAPTPNLPGGTPGGGMPKLPQLGGGKGKKTGAGAGPTDPNIVGPQSQQPPFNWQTGEGVENAPSPGSMGLPDPDSSRNLPALPQLPGASGTPLGVGGPDLTTPVDAPNAPHDMPVQYPQVRQPQLPAAAPPAPPPANTSNLPTSGQSQAPAPVTAPGASDIPLGTTASITKIPGAFDVAGLQSDFESFGVPAEVGSSFGMAGGNQFPDMGGAGDFGGGMGDFAPMDVAAGGFGDFGGGDIGGGDLGGGFGDFGGGVKGSRGGGIPGYQAGGGAGDPGGMSPVEPRFTNPLGDYIYGPDFGTSVLPTDKDMSSATGGSGSYYAVQQGGGVLGYQEGGDVPDDGSGDIVSVDSGGVGGGTSQADAEYANTMRATNPNLADWGGSSPPSLSGPGSPDWVIPGNDIPDWRRAINAPSQTIPQTPASSDIQSHPAIQNAPQPYDPYAPRTYPSVKSVPLPQAYPGPTEAYQLYMREKGFTYKPRTPPADFLGWSKKNWPNQRRSGGVLGYDDGGDVPDVSVDGGGDIGGGDPGADPEMFSPQIAPGEIQSNLPDIGAQQNTPGGSMLPEAGTPGSDDWYNPHVLGDSAGLKSMVDLNVPVETSGIRYMGFPPITPRGQFPDQFQQDLDEANAEQQGQQAEDWNANLARERDPSLVDRGVGPISGPGTPGWAQTLGVAATGPDWKLTGPELYNAAFPQPTGAAVHGGMFDFIQPASGAGAPTGTPTGVGGLTRGERNNNPGNIKRGPDAVNFGATGYDAQNHAIFPNWDAGEAAQGALLQRHYNGMTINQMSRVYTEPPWSNDWARGVSKFSGFDQNDRPNLNDDATRLSFQRAIQRQEGTRPPWLRGSGWGSGIAHLPFAERRGGDIRRGGGVRGYDDGGGTDGGDGDDDHPFVSEDSGGGGDQVAEVHWSDKIDEPDLPPWRPKPDAETPVPSPAPVRARGVEPPPGDADSSDTEEVRPAPVAADYPAGRKFDITGPGTPEWDEALGRLPPSVKTQNTILAPQPYAASPLLRPAPESIYTPRAGLRSPAMLRLENARIQDATRLPPFMNQLPPFGAQPVPSTPISQTSGLMKPHEFSTLRQSDPERAAALVSSYPEYYTPEFMDKARQFETDRTSYMAWALANPTSRFLTSGMGGGFGAMPLPAMPAPAGAGAPDVTRAGPVPFGTDVAPEQAFREGTRMLGAPETPVTGVAPKATQGITYAPGSEAAAVADAAASDAAAARRASSNVASADVASAGATPSIDDLVNAPKATQPIKMLPRDADGNPIIPPTVPPAPAAAPAAPATPPVVPETPPAAPVTPAAPAKPYIGPSIDWQIPKGTPAGEHGWPQVWPKEYYAPSRPLAGGPRGTATAVPSGQIQNSYLANQRAPLFDELQQKPWLVKALASIGERENSGKPLGILEAMFNRAIQGHQSLEQAVRGAFWGDRTRNLLTSDMQNANFPQNWINNAQSALGLIRGGSNVTRGATDQGQSNEIKGQKWSYDGEYYGDMDANSTWRQRQQAEAAKAGFVQPVSQQEGPQEVRRLNPFARPQDLQPGESLWHTYPDGRRELIRAVPSSSAADEIRGAQTLPVAQGHDVRTSGVDQRLQHMLAGAKTDFEAANPGYRVVATSGYRTNDPRSFHDRGLAMDTQIIGPDGPISNEGNDPTGKYRQFARMVYGQQQQNFPELHGQLAWGGAFGSDINNPGGSPRDLMHFDLGGERGRYVDFRPSQLGAILPGGTRMAAYDDQDQNPDQISDSSGMRQITPWTPDTGGGVAGRRPTASAIPSNQPIYTRAPDGSYTDSGYTYGDLHPDGGGGGRGGFDLSANSRIWPAMITAGAAMMASGSPYFGVALGQGLLAGQGEYSAALAAERSGDMEQRKIDLEAQKIYQTQQNELKKQDLEERKFQQTPRLMGHDRYGSPIYGLPDQRTGVLRPITIDPETGVVAPLGLPGVPGSPGSANVPGPPGTKGGMQLIDWRTLSPDEARQRSESLQSTNAEEKGSGSLVADNATPFENLPQRPTVPTYIDENGQVHGEGYLDTIQDPAEKQIVRQIAMGRTQYPTGFLLRTPWGRKIAEEVGLYDPSYNAQRYRTFGEFAYGKKGDNVTSFNTAIAHASDMDRSIDSMPQLLGGWSTDINWLKNKYGEHFAGNIQNALADFQARKTALTEELTRAFRMSGGNVHDIQEWAKTMDPAKSPEANHVALRAAMGLLGERIGAVSDQYYRAMGMRGRDPEQMLSPRAREALARLSSEQAGTQPQKSGQPQNAPATPAAPKEGERRQFKQGWGVYRGGKWVPETP